MILLAVISFDFLCHKQIKDWFSLLHRFPTMLS